MNTLHITARIFSILTMSAMMVLAIFAQGTSIPDGPCPPPSGQIPGSVLIYDSYTSGATSGNTQNTAINITNTDSGSANVGFYPSAPITTYVHLFFVAEGCSVADSYICLTPYQTARFLASDFDPGISGYLVAVAVDKLGCPKKYNHLIGDEYVKFTSGHSANLNAQAYRAIAPIPSVCDANSVTAEIAFNDMAYGPGARVLALDNLDSRADGNDTLIIINRIGGNLGIGAFTLGTLFGLLYDDDENALSFSVSGSCQLRNSLSNNFPRTAPRLETFIPAGRTGWLRIFSQSDIAISGAVINFNANTASSAGAFNQGHSLHILSLSKMAVYTIPVFPPSC